MRPIDISIMHITQVRSAGRRIAAMQGWSTIREDRTRTWRELDHTHAERTPANPAAGTGLQRSRPGCAKHLETVMPVSLPHAANPVGLLVSARRAGPMGWVK